MKPVAVRLVETESDGAALFQRVGEFLCSHRLSPDPLHYAFAYRVLSDGDSALARTVREITDGGVRLTRRDIEMLGGEVTLQATPAAECTKGDGLVAQTQMQVEGFTDMMQAMRAETQDFGRDLAASAAAIRAEGGVDEVARIAAAMIERVHTAEERLEAATEEANELRAKLEEARDNARRDPLTDLPNRRAFEEAYAERALSGATLCLAMCDIDHFKAVNDRFGHAVGDRVLKAIAEALLKACDGHLVARYGGEEFAILFIGVERCGARHAGRGAGKANRQAHAAARIGRATGHGDFFGRGDSGGTGRSAGARVRPSRPAALYRQGARPEPAGSGIIFTPNCGEISLNHLV